MSIQQSAVDLYYMAQELKNQLVGAKIDQIYQYEKKTFAIRFHKSGVGKKECIIEVPKCLYLTKNRPSAPKKQLAMSAYFRKSIKGMFVEDIFQPGFTRVICMSLSFKDVKKYVFFEFFDKGNIIVCTQEKDEYVIEMPIENQKWSDREIRKGQVYIPEAKTYPHELSLNDIGDILRQSTDSVSKVFATVFGLGGMYAEIVCNWSNIPLQAVYTDDMADSIQSSFASLFSQKLAPKIVQNKNGTAIKAILPFSGEQSYTEYSQPFDEYCTPKIGSQKEDAKLKKFQKELQKIESMIKHQEKTQKKLEKDSVVFTEIGKYVQTHYHKMETYIQKGQKAESLQDDELSTFLKENQILSIDKKAKTVTVAKHE
ncbi:MAG: NFACT family protein [Candidatus Woesearchaeota archaeon]